MKRGSYFKYQYDESKQMPKTSYYRKIKQEREALNNPIKQESDVDTLVAITNEKITNHIEPNNDVKPLAEITITPEEKTTDVEMLKRRVEYLERLNQEAQLKNETISAQLAEANKTIELLKSNLNKINFFYFLSSL
jgi:hypothetical protein